MQSAGTWSNSPYQAPFKSTTNNSQGDVATKDEIKRAGGFPSTDEPYLLGGLFARADDVVACNLKLTKGGVICYKCVICSRVSPFSFFFLVVPFMQTAHPAASLAVICTAY